MAVGVQEDDELGGYPSFALVLLSMVVRKRRARGHSSAGSQANSGARVAKLPLVECGLLEGEDGASRQGVNSASREMCLRPDWPLETGGCPPQVRHVNYPAALPGCLRWRLLVQAL